MSEYSNVNIKFKAYNSPKSVNYLENVLFIMSIKSSKLPIKIFDQFILSLVKFKNN